MSTNLLLYVFSYEQGQHSLPRQDCCLQFNGHLYFLQLVFMTCLSPFFSKLFCSVMTKSDEDCTAVIAHYNQMVIINVCPLKI